MTERTQEQIIAQCEARMRQLEAQAEDERARTTPDPERPFCSTCKWLVGSQTNVNGSRCHEPLVKGLGDAPYVHDAPDGTGERPCALCGPEKALWQPRPSALRRAAVPLSVGTALTVGLFGGLYLLFGWLGVLTPLVVGGVILASIAAGL